MTPNPITIRPDSDYLAAIAIMRAGRFRHLPVIDQDGHLAGLVSVKDLRAVSTEAAGSLRPQAIQSDGVLVRVGEIMTRDVFTIPPDYPLEEAARLMVEHKIGCLPVVENGKPVGIITDTDIFQTLVVMLGGGSQTIRVSVQVNNIPGQIAELCQRVAAVGGNILSIASHPARGPERMNLTLRVESVPLDTLLEAVAAHPGAEIRHSWDQAG
jgi:acetoin utilization protein AcuB